MMQTNQLQLSQISPLNITSIVTFMHIILSTLVRHQHVFLVQLEVVSGETLFVLTLLRSYLSYVGIDPLWSLRIIHHVHTL